MLTETELLVLRGVRYSDSASIITTYSDLYGALSFRVSRPTRRSASGGARAFFVPLSLLSVTMDYHQGRTVQVPREVTPLHVVTTASIDPVVNAVVLFVSELLSHLLRAQGTDRSLFGFLRAQISALDTMSGVQAASFHLRLMAGLCYHLGVMPDCDCYVPGSVLDVTDGGFRPPLSSIDYGRREASALLVRFFTEEHPEHIPLCQEQRRQLLTLMLDYLSFHFPEVSGLHSPSILGGLFA